MGFYFFWTSGCGFLLIGGLEALISYYTLQNQNQNQNQNPSSHQPTTIIIKDQRKNPLISSLRFITVALLSLFFLLNSLISSIDAHHAKDQLGFALQLVIISISSLFLLYSFVSFLRNFTNFLPLPSTIPTLILLFAFGQEFLFFYIQRKDTSGIENRYFDLLLVPIGVCMFTTLLELGYPKSNFVSLARGVGLVLHGTWFLQMGISIFTNLIAHGCVLHERSRGNFTVKCKGHPEYHRGRALAILQFNCHLGFLVVLVVGVYSLIGMKYGFPGEYSNYKPLNAELQSLSHRTQFTLDSDDEESTMVDGDNVVKQKGFVAIVSETVVNGYGAH